jgi:UPF0176 protein
MAPYYVIGFYRFTPIKDRELLQTAIRSRCEDLQLKGSIYLAKEGINASLAGTHSKLCTFLDWLEQDSRFQDLRVQWSGSNTIPFYRFKVRLKQEIVTLGIGDVDPRCRVGTYVKPSQWNELIQRPDVLLIDTRNDYEYRLGHFQNAINPDTVSFRDFPKYVSENLDPEQKQRVAMYCTGGIRCEKATAYLLDKGFSEVFHLEGGILNYLAEVEERESLWDGDCFIFDQRTALGHGLRTTNASVCNACWSPITEADRASVHYTAGESCPYCVHEKTHAQRLRYRERQQQVSLARQRNEKHIGRTVENRSTNQVL